MKVRHRHSRSHGRWKTGGGHGGRRHPEFVVPGETGLLVEAGNAAALADAMDLLRDPERARQMGIRGRARVLAAFQMSTVVRRHEQGTKPVWVMPKVEREVTKAQRCLSCC
jgi:hypothetical protein